MEQLYDMIYKRKSVRRYDTQHPLTAAELAEIEAQLKQLQPLDAAIPVEMCIVKRSETSCLWGEYCLLLYSAEQDGYLANAGYLLEQMDLWFASRDIGACWYGLGKTGEKQRAGLSFVIMMAFGRCQPEAFRQSMRETKRIPLSRVYTGAPEPAVESALQAAHYAPSACNSQPWQVICEPGKLTVQQERGLKNPLLKHLAGYMNRIDMGIFFCFLELALSHEGISFRRVLLPDGRAEYHLTTL